MPNIEPLISIIVPVYNVEPYIGESLSSLVNQTLDDALLELVEKKKISGEDAYINSIEKAKFLKYLKRQPSDFTEV